MQDYMVDSWPVDSLNLLTMIEFLVQNIMQAIKLASYVVRLINFHASKFMHFLIIIGYKYHRLQGVN